jgi:hypothetical protein
MRLRHLGGLMFFGLLKSLYHVGRQHGLGFEEGGFDSPDDVPVQDCFRQALPHP